MPIDTRHDEYLYHAPDWQMCRDAIAGQTAIRLGREKYLPIPPGMKSSISSQVDLNTRTVISNSDGRYEFYLQFAEFPEVVALQVNGVQGLIHSTEIAVELPEKLEYLRETATPDGLTLMELWELITRELQSTGKLNLLAEVMPEDDTVRLCAYSVESLTNWRLGEKRDGEPLVMAVLEEHTTEPDVDDEFEERAITRWRELRLDESERYMVRRWIQTDDGDPEVELDPATGQEWVVPMFFGQPFDNIPLWPINAVGTGFDYGTIPILPIVRRALAIYRMSADYRRALHIKTDPQAVLFGVDAREVPTSIGGSQIWAFSNPAGHAEYLDVEGGGIPMLQQAIDDEYHFISAESGRMIDTTRTNSAESGEAIRRRQSFQMVTVTSLVVNAATSLEEIIRAIGRHIGLDNSSLDQITVTPDLSFTESEMTYEDLVHAMTAKNQGAPLALKDIHDDMRARRLVSRTFEEFLDEQSSEVPLINEPGIERHDSTQSPSGEGQPVAGEGT